MSASMMFDAEEHAPRTAPPRAPMRQGYELPPNTLCYDVGDWTRMLYADEVDASAELDHAIEQARARDDNGEACETLFGEVFGRLYDFDTEKKSEPASHAKEWASKLHEIAEECDAWKRVRDMARGDAYIAGLATAEIASTLLQELPKHLPKDPEKLEGEIDGLEQMLLAAKGKRRKAKISKRLDAARAEMEANQYTAEEATKEMQARAGDVGREIEEALGRVIVEVERVRETLDALGGSDLSALGGGSGAGKGLSSAAVRRAVRRVQGDKRLQNIAALAGRFRARVHAEKKAKTDGPEEIHAVELGDNLQRLLPTEKMMLGTGGIGAALVYSRMLDRAAQQYAVRSNDRRSKGPIVFALDESGSMEMTVGNTGTRDTWAKAVALAVMQRCIEERRSFAVVHFSGGVARIDASEKPWTLTFEEIADMVGFFADGGTNIGDALIRAGALANGIDASWKPTQGKADVVLVTDGEDPRVTADGIKAALGDAALHTIGIASSIGAALRTASSTVTHYTAADLISGVLPEIALQQ